MDQDPHFQLGDVRRDLEYDYLALSYQMTHLLESRARERAALDEIGRWVEELVVTRKRVAAGTDTKLLDELTETVLSEADSVVRLGIQTSAFRDQFRILQRQMAEIGRQLGYW